MKEEILSQITELDKVISTLRDGWLDCVPEKKESWMARINKMLDTRLQLMAARDACH